MEIEKSNVFQVYSQIAYHFNNTRHYKWRSVDDFLDTLSPGSFVLDIGCGNGRNMENTQHNFIGIDTCKEFLTICDRKRLKTVNSDMTAIPFRDKLFDSIISVASFHHLATVERRIQAIKEMFRVLKIGGKVFLTVWSINQPKKTKRNFKKYGDNYVVWKYNNTDFQRYYYIFKVDELNNLFISGGFRLDNYYWDCGNEIVVFIK
jgi:tRNA (uracil-5-)-methyltransferase TRM9